MSSKENNVAYLLSYNPSTGILSVEDILPGHMLNEQRDAEPQLPKRRLLGTSRSINPRMGTDGVKPSQALFFRLPSELRLMVYIHLLGRCTPPEPAYDVHVSGRHQLTLDMLLVNRQIYTEARLIPFRYNSFEFAKWNGTGLLFCQSFLRRLQDWQRKNVRSMNLDIPGTMLTSEASSGRWLDLCGELGCSENKGEGLAKLRLTISGCIMKCGQDTFNIKATWIARGLLQLSSLQSLEIIVNATGIDRGLLTMFADDLQHRLKEVKIVVKVGDRGRTSTVYLSVLC